MTAEAEANVLITLDEVASAGRTALYRLRDAAMDLLYIGISDDPIARMKQHAREQSWWPEVAHKSVVWYATREAADTAETIAIGLEQPRHNKAKRYVRLPEQPFPTEDRRGALRRARTDGSGLPARWPADMWCRTWWERHGRGWIQDEREWGLRETALQTCPLLAPSKSAANVEWATEKYLADGYMAPQVWHQADGGKEAYSAHFDHSFGPGRLSHMDRLPDGLLEPMQRAFLDALVAAGRCTKASAGTRAAAWGFGDQVEAAVAGTLLELLIFGHVELVKECTEAAKRQAPTLLGDRG